MPLGVSVIPKTNYGKFPGDSILDTRRLGIHTVPGQADTRIEALVAEICDLLPAGEYVPSPATRRLMGEAVHREFQRREAGSHPDQS